MIRVEPAPPPTDFNARVREPGLSALGELVGEAPIIKRPGPRRKKKASRREDLASEHFPDFWTRVLDQLCSAYGRICAYTSLYIYPVTGTPTVDHMIPKTADWTRAYEWSNYRLACLLMNTRKNTHRDVLDPFEICDDWFGMEFVSFQVTIREGLATDIKKQVGDTIARLGLNDRECCEARAEYVRVYEDGGRLEDLERKAPFIAREMRRQGLLRAEDSG